MPATDTMRAVRVKDGRALVLDRVPLPEPAAGEVRVKIEACGICGTDLHLLGTGGWPQGHIPGHEMAGRIDAVGTGVDRTPGERVAVEPVRCCGTCDPCLRGDRQICRQLRLLGVHIAGGFSEYAVVPAERATPVAEDLLPALAALTEPVAVAIHGLLRGGFAAGQRVLVLGAGPVGLVTTLCARTLGAAEVWQSARYPRQAELASRFGAGRILAEDEATPEALGLLSSQVDFDLVVESVGGRADTLRAACHAIRPGGTVSVLGVFLGRPEVDPYPLLVKEGTLAWSNCYGGDRDASDFTRATALVDTERKLLSELNTHQYSLDDAPTALATAQNKSAGALKVTLLPT
ncbi:MAG: alcohol dehydrogenase catalytic domain-containing protein [Proteobacteria bacterium]|nr:alcohol dehydrogenase catalytic domain-containing protein [Pseudomonadota bacterium]